MLRRGDASLPICVKLLLYIGWRLTLSLPNVAKGKFRTNIQISFSKILTNKQHHVKVQAESFHLIGHIIGFRLQTQKLESPYKIPSSTLAVKGLKITCYGYRLRKGTPCSKKDANGIFFQKNNASPVRTQNHCLPLRAIGKILDRCYQGRILTQCYYFKLPLAMGFEANVIWDGGSWS